VKPYNRVTLLKKYGLTVGAFEDMLSAQHNQCAICYDWLETTPHVDHHHGTGRVRGLLCRRCNIGIGHFREDERILSSALAYVHFDGPHFSTVSVSFTRKS
jgi:hypothetical protein